MKSYIYVLSTVTILSIWATIEPGMAAQRDELIPKINFEPFVYVLYLITGLSIFVSSNPAKISGVSSNFVIPFSAAFTGWALGITIAEVIELNFKNFIVGMLLTAIMFVVTLAPVIQSWLLVRLAEDVRNRWFIPKSRIWVVYIASVGFIALGSFGLITWHMG